MILGVSPTKAEPLRVAQREIGLDFPLLYDDRDFSRAYGVVAPAEGQADPGIFLVDRDQKVCLAENPLDSMEAAVGRIMTTLQRQPSPTYHYPRKTVNRIVDWWVNKFRRSRVA